MKRHPACAAASDRGLSEDAGVVADHDVLLGRDVRRQLHKHVGLGRSDRPDEREEVVPAPDEARDGAPVAADANDVTVLAELDHVGEANGPGRQLQRVIYVEGVHLHPAPPAVARVPGSLDRSPWGIIAISFSKIINKGDKVLVFSDEKRASDELSRDLDRVASQARRAQEFSGKAIGLLFHTATPARHRESGLLVHADETLIEHLARPETVATP
jgi:hypothetical protein